jgi:SpoVK/Ycf46/Vps4 family AAA+-type ATPase
MVPERLEALRDAARVESVLLAYGPYVKDAFVDQAYRRYGLGEALWEVLHDAGFSRIVFFSLRGMLRVRDAASRLENGSGAATTTGETPTMSGGFAGPLGSMIVDPPPRREEPASSPMGMSDPHALKMLEHLLDKPAEPTAVVFEQAEVIARYNEARRGLAAALERWLEYRPGVRKACVLVFARDDLAAVRRSAEEIARDLPAVLTATEVEQRRRSPRPGLIGPPGEAELTRLVHRARVRTGFAIDDWAALPRVIRALAAENEPLWRWEERLERVLPAHGLPLGHQTARDLGWISGPVDKGDVWQRIDELKGLDDIKSHLKGLRYRPRAGGEAPAHHMVFMGNPGTGKTTVAALVGEVLREAGILARGHVEAVKASDLISQHVGETALKTDSAVDRAIDGVLFVDEAYSLSEQAENAGFGKEAIDTLLARMENDRDRLVVVVAGYRDDMRRFLATNQGLRDRFPESGHLDFPDYDPETLHAIAVAQLRAVDPPYTWDEDFETALRKVVTGLYEARDATFGNARVIRNLTAEIGMRWARRVEDDRAAPLAVADLPVRHRRHLNPAPPTAEELFGPLDDMVGLAAVKDGLRRLVAQIDLHRRLGGPEKVVAPHLLFLGPPGTGKTTVAREIARIFHRLGLLAKGHSVEVGRENLVGGYLGQTARLTGEAFDKALGGVLFIDEAYALAPVDSGGHAGGTDPYGREAINVINQHMENHRGRVVVIAAGYQEPMDRFLAANEGLRSRFTARLQFPAYSLPELLEILRRDVAARGFRLGEGTEDRARDLLARAMTDPGFGNARSVRKLQDQLNGALSVRVFGRDLDDTTLRTYLPEDVPDELW